jgi:hypothetical protein
MILNIIHCQECRKFVLGILESNFDLLAITIETGTHRAIMLHGFGVGDGRLGG